MKKIILIITMMIFSTVALSVDVNLNVDIPEPNRDVEKKIVIVKYRKDGTIKKIKTKTVKKKAKKSNGYKDDPNEDDTNGGFASY